MDLSENGKLIRDLRKRNGMTQKELAEKLFLQPKTISKWETGHGFPDVSTISDLAKIFKIDTETLLAGRIIKNREDNGNMKRIIFYACEDCGSILSGTGAFSVSCCGKQLEALTAKKPDEKHLINVEEIENDYYITFQHEMKKEHYISFVSYVTYDKVLTVRLYPEQDAAVRFPKLHGGKIYYYCNKHGLFVK